MAELPEGTRNRLEQFLNNIAGGGVELPEGTRNRLEQYLAYIAEHGDSAAGVVAPAYDATATYTAGDLTIYDGKLYTATVDITTPEEWTAAHWTETTVADEYRTAAAQDVIDSGKVNTTDYAPVTKTAAMTQAVGVDTDGKLYTAPDTSDFEQLTNRPKYNGTAMTGSTNIPEVIREPHPYAYDGIDLKAYFGTAAALHTALAVEDYSHIHNGDYYPITFNGSYRDYGEWVALAGTKYYSDTACTQEAGTLETDTVVTYADASPAYYDITISGTTYHVKMQDCQRYREKTINAAAKMEANINPYWQYGDSGVLSGAKPHIMWLARDVIGNFKMRSSNQQWADAVEQFATGDGTTTVYTPDDATLKCVRYVCVNGTLQTYNTAYTVDTATGKVTFKSGYIPANGAAIIISRTTHDNPWLGSAIYKTLNDTEHGLMRLITDTEFAEHILGGDGMRYYGETRTVTNSTAGGWFSRGKGFLPTEPEVWGEVVHGIRNHSFLPQLPIFAEGGKRHISKGSSNGGSRNGWWVASSHSTTNFCSVNDSGNASDHNARNAGALVPGFITT